MRYMQDSTVHLVSLQNISRYNYARKYLVLFDNVYAEIRRSILRPAEQLRSLTQCGERVEATNQTSSGSHHYLAERIDNQGNDFGMHYLWFAESGCKHALPSSIRCQSLGRSLLLK